MATPDAKVIYEVSDSVATLTLNRPDVLNALDGELLTSLGTSFDRAAKSAAEGTIRAVLLRANGRGFCAGADLADPGIQAAGTDLGTHLRRHFHGLVEGMRRLPAPIVCAVNGPAAGAGMSLALACDIVLAGDSASFVQVFSRIGLIPDAGSTYFLPRLVGESRARALALLADKLSAEQARQFGLVWQVVPDDALQDTAFAMAKRLATQPTRAYALIKETMNASLRNDLSTQLELEACNQARAGRTEDFKEGVAAFLEKRKAAFKGR